MQKGKVMKSSLFLACILFSNLAFGQEGQFIQDLPVSFASTQLQLTYLEEGATSPSDGYLLTVSDLALIKLIVDDSEASCTSIIEDIKGECSKDISSCQRAATSRFEDIIIEKDNLTLRNTILETKLEDQKTSFILYTAFGVTTSVFLTILVMNVAN